MADRATLKNWFFGLIGGAAGAAFGYFVFLWMARQGFYAMIIPGACLGLGCGLLSGVKSPAMGVVCGVSAILLGLFTEWKFAPFKDDPSFEYLIMNVHKLRPVTQIMIILGGVAGYWFGTGRDGGV